MPNKWTEDSSKHFIAGGFAGIIEVCIAHPFDCMKTRVQIGQYNRIIECIKSTIKNEGFSGFYKGLWPPLIIETPKRAIKFTSFDFFRRAFCAADQYLPEWTRFSLAGLFTGLTEALLVCPFEVVKVRLQSELNIPLSMQKSWNSIALQIIRERGFGTNGLYLGVGPNLWRHGVWNSCYFGIYHNLRSFLSNPFSTENDQKIGLSFRFSIASFSAIIANLANIPFDVAKSRIQGPQPSKDRYYFTTWQTISLVQQHQGFFSIYRSLSPLAFIFGLGGGLMLVTYENIYSWLCLNQKEKNEKQIVSTCLSTPPAADIL
uniref:Mitochondrial 2-oxodicarboxylate carrier n=1 Tax=Meloidogyne incognita TaxID=6306 RepID=A0A914MVN9_MELIC